MSSTDPDASPMWTAGKARLGYHDHYVVDGGKRRIVLAALVTPADVMENQPMLDLLWRVRFRRKLHPRQVAGDTNHGTVENIVALDEEGIRAYVPLPDTNHRRLLYGQDNFTYDATQDQYRCPAGHALVRERVKHTEGMIVYGLMPRLATAVNSRRSARRAVAAGSSIARSSPITWSGCGPTTRPRPIGKPCVNARSGSSRSSPRPSCGMAYVASGGEGSRTSTSRAC